MTTAPPRRPARAVGLGLAGAALAVTLATAPAPTAAAAPGTPGTGTVIDSLAATPLVGALTLAGAGLALTPSSVPGQFGDPVIGSVLTVTDTTLTTNGWSVTAAYSDPTAAGISPLGGANIRVSTSGVGTGGSGGPGPSKIATVSQAPLSSPVTVLSTTTNSGAGMTVATADYRVRIPVDATADSRWGGVVTYTVASVR